MMPLTLATVGEENMIKKVGGNPEVRAHLEDLGFVPGAVVTIISPNGGNLILNIKDSRFSINRQMDGKIKILYYFKEGRA